MEEAVTQYNEQNLNTFDFYWEKTKKFWISIGNPFRLAKTTLQITGRVSFKEHDQHLK